MNLQRSPQRKRLSPDSDGSGAVDAFRAAVRCRPWYSRYLASMNVDPDSVKSESDFIQKVPVLDKEQVFGQHRLTELLTPVGLQQLGTVMISSGHSGTCSFGAGLRSVESELADQTDRFLNRMFGIRSGEALIINASAMGVRANTRHVCCDTGMRSDLVIGLIKQLAPDFPKLVISSGDPHFLKKLVEDALEAGIDWQSLTVFLITGGDWFPESLRTYIHRLTGKSAFSPEAGYWSAIYGLTELGYPLFFESPGLAQIRHTFWSDRPALLSQLDAEQWNCTTPFLFHHDPEGVYAETLLSDNGWPRLVLTVLNQAAALPLIRYDTGDLGWTNVRLPEFSGSGLPVTAFMGRLGNRLTDHHRTIWLTDLKELLFDDVQLTSRITGYFSLQHHGGRVKWSVQLKPDQRPTPAMTRRLNDLLHHHYPEGIDLVFVAYHRMKHQMSLDFERKFNHLI